MCDEAQNSTNQIAVGGGPYKDPSSGERLPCYDSDIWRAAVPGVTSEFPVVLPAAAAEGTPEYVGPCP